LIIDDLPEITTGAEKNPWNLAEKPGTSGERVKSWQHVLPKFGDSFSKPLGTTEKGEH
jgi:hypothetical protein